jgi:hypothetical protein
VVKVEVDDEDEVEVEVKPVVEADIDVEVGATISRSCRGRDRITAEIWIAPTVSEEL